jgi:hypothetical protein
MLAFADIEAETTVDQLTLRRELLGSQSIRAEETVNGVCALEHLELAGGVGPLVAFGGGEQDRAWGAEGYQAILVERQPLHVIVELFELGVEPVREHVVDALDGFTDLAAARRCAAATRLMWEGDGDAFVIGGSQQGSVTR